MVGLAAGGVAPERPHHTAPVGRRRLVVVSALLAIALLLFLVAASWLSPRTDDARLRRFVAEQALRKPAAGVRQPLFGDAVPESAALGYAAAVALRRYDEPREAAGDGMARWLGERVADRPVVVGELQPVLMALRRATHATTAARSVAQDDAVALRTVVRLATDDALDRSDGEAAVGSWLDEARLVCDAIEALTGQDGGLLWDRWTPTLLAGLDEPALRLLATGLERLDAQWPLHSDVAQPLAVSAAFWLDDGRSPPADLDERLRAWRRGFDVRAEALTTCEMLLTTLPTMTPPAADWPARERQWRAFLVDPSDRCSGEVLWWMFHLCEGEQARFAGQARLRLLRLAVAFTLGDELAELADPFAAAPLQVDLRGDEATFRSASLDPVLIQRAVRR